VSVLRGVIRWRTWPFVRSGVVQIGGAAVGGMALAPRRPADTNWFQEIEQRNRVYAAPADNAQ
jgi:hypothetical protein